MRTLADIRKEGREMTYLRPDSKSQVTIQYSDAGIPERIDTIVVSTQHDEFDTDDARMLAKIREDVINILIPRVKQNIHSEKVLALFGDDIKYYVNPTGKFVIGGPHGDTGLTGAVAPSPARIPVRSTAVLPMPPDISLRTWWLPVLPTRCWYR